MSTFVTSNGITMTKSSPLNWERKSVYASGGAPYFHHIYVGGIAEGHGCSFDKGILSISYLAYSSDNPPLRFKVKDLDEAGEIVKKFAEGMGISHKGTIYE